MSQAAGTSRIAAARARAATKGRAARGGGRIFSRFRPDSELNQVNRSRALVVEVSPEFVDMATRALRVAAGTNGLVDPTLGDAIEVAGYDRDFAELRPVAEPTGAGTPGCWQSVRVGRGWLSRPPGLKLDLNGVVKSRTVDDALRLISGRGVVSAGGDIAASRPVDVELPAGEAIRLVRGGLARSGTPKRRWLRAGSWQHHLLDPRTGRVADSPWLEVTVSAATCLQADVAAKVAFLFAFGGPKVARRPRAAGPLRRLGANRHERELGRLGRASRSMTVAYLAVDWYAARAADRERLRAGPASRSRRSTGSAGCSSGSSSRSTR